MTQNAYRDEPVMNKQPTTLEQLFGRFNVQLERLEMFANGLENFGHKLSDTNRPKPDPIDKIQTSALVQNDGVLSELEIKLNKQEACINRLEETGKKISELV
jgi:hypothetical protein